MSRCTPGRRSPCCRRCPAAREHEGMRATAAVVLLVPLLATLPFGAGAFAAVAVLIGVVVLIDLSGLLTAAAARPVVLAALVPVIAVPLTALGEDGWSAV